MTGIDEFLSPPKGEERSQVDDFLGVAKPGFAPTVKRTSGQMLTTLATSVEDLTGQNPATEAVRRVGQDIVERNPAGITSLGDIADSPWLTVKEAVGQYVPQIGAAAAGGVAGARIGQAVAGAPGAAAGGAVGSLVPIFTQEYGGIREDQKGQGQDDIARALTAGAAATALERVGMGKVLKGIRGELPSISTIPREVLAGTLREGATEAAQTAIEQVGAFKDPTTRESIAEQALAGALGGIGGGVVGGAHAGVQKALAPQVDQPPGEAPQTDVAALPGDPLRTAKLPEVGPLTRGVNLLVEQEAQAADGGAPVEAAVSGALAGLPAEQAPTESMQASEDGAGRVPVGEATELPAEAGAAIFDPVSATIAQPQRATFASEQEVTDHLRTQRRSGGASQGKALPIEAGDGRWTFVRKGEPEFERAQQAQQQREADDKMRADAAFAKAAESMPAHLRSLSPQDRKVFGLDRAVEAAQQPWKGPPIGEQPGPTGEVFTPERAVMQAAKFDAGVKERDGKLRSGNRTGATTAELVSAWTSQQALRRSIEESKKAQPELWKAYDERQAAVKALRIGDEVVTPYPSPSEPAGSVGKITRKFGVNWRVEYQDGNTVMVPPAALRPVPSAAAQPPAESPSTRATAAQPPAASSEAPTDAAALWAAATQRQRIAAVAKGGQVALPTQTWTELTAAQRIAIAPHLPGASKPGGKPEATTTEGAANATGQVVEQAGVQGQREEGDRGGPTAEAGRGDRLQRAEAGGVEEAQPVAAAPRTLNEDGRASDGKPIMPGDVFATRSGRQTTPYPKQKGQKHASQWLVDNAVAEAKSRGDGFNETVFSGEKPLRDGTLPTASRESMLMYLFGEQPAVAPSILRPLSPAPAAPANAAATSTKEQSDEGQRQEGRRQALLTPEQDAAAPATETGPAGSGSSAVPRGVGPEAAAPPATPPTGAATTTTQDDALTMPDERIAQFEGQAITIDAMVADTGKHVKLTLDATTAIRDIRKRMAAARELQGCLA